MFAVAEKNNNESLFDKLTKHAKTE